MEINARRNCFMPSENHINYITVSGFDINKAATTWAPPAAYQDGMIGPHWAKGWIIEDCEISNSKCCGISLGKYYDAEMTIILQIGMSKVQHRWKEMPSAEGSIMDGRKKT